MIVLSLDDSSQELAEYLNGNQLFFEPLWLSQKTGGMAAALKPYGCNYQNRIPYTAVIDGSGKAIREWTGVTDYNNFAIGLKKLWNHSGRKRNPSLRLSGSLSVRITSKRGFR